MEWYSTIKKNVYSVDKHWEHNSEWKKQIIKYQIIYLIPLVWDDQNKKVIDFLGVGDVKIGSNKRDRFLFEMMQTS